jgi:histidine decarboxylase
MLSRRQFLTRASATGAVMATCRPDNLLAQSELSAIHEFSGTSREYLLKRKKILKTDPKIFLGYPGNYNLPPEGYFKWRDELFKSEIGARGNNNAGDPYHNRSAYSSHFLEADTIDTFGARFGFDSQDTWGFISHSGTDSNMHGAYIGRTLLTQKTGIVPKVYYTSETHYSIEIIRDLLRMQEVLVDTTEDGAMDISDFKDKLKQNNDAPVLVLATIGTTFKGAIDDIDAIQEALRGTESYVHLDAALFGGYFQASEFAKDVAATGPSGKRYDSISVSCHKFFGLPMTAGIFVTNNSTFQEFREYFSLVHNPAYISHVPGTITTSRNTLSPALFHYFSTEEAFEIQKADSKSILENARYFHKEMQNHFPELEAKIANNKSNIVHFNRVSDEIKRKWVLATIETGAGESLTHVVVMPHATKHYLDMFLSDLDDARQKT